MTDQIVTLWRCTVCGKTEPNSGQSARYCGQTKACAKRKRNGTYDLAPMERVDYVPVGEVEQLQKALHSVCELTHQDIDPDETAAELWHVISEVHDVARAAVEPREESR